MTTLFIVLSVISLSAWGIYAIRASAIYVKSASFIFLVLLPVSIYLATRPIDDLHEWFQRQKDIKALEVSIAKENSVDAVIAKLEIGVSQKPDDPVGWFLLGKMHYLSSNYPEAVKAYEKAYQFTQDSEVLHKLVQSMFWRDQLSLNEQSIIWTHELLRKHPEHYGLLNMLAIDAYKLDLFDDAIALWQDSQAEPYLPTTELEAIQQGLNEAQMKLKQVGIKPHSHKLHVEITGDLGQKHAPEETVFIVVRDVYKPRAPIAIIKRRVADLPINMTISSKHAMVKGHDIDHAHRVLVHTKISRTGMVMSSPEDTQSTVKLIELPGVVHLQLKAI